VSAQAENGSAQSLVFHLGGGEDVGDVLAAEELVEAGDFDVEEDVTRLVRAIMSLGVDLVRWYRLEGTDKPDELADSYAGLVQRMLGARVGD